MVTTLTGVAKIYWNRIHEGKMTLEEVAPKWHDIVSAELDREAKEEESVSTEN